MLVPFFTWAITGLFFFIKPGYAGAYETLQAKTYPLDGEILVKPDSEWLEFRYLKTVLGTHLLAKTSGGWRHLDAATRSPKSSPDDEETRALVQDAMSANPQRYGNIISIAENKITTDTGVQITLDWNRLSLSQRGPDTDRIDLLYRIHYLQWTGLPALDRAIGFAGIALILILSALGLRLFFTPR
jgi:hypothetical protein